MKQQLKGALAALLLATLAVAGWSAVRWKHHTDVRTYYAEQSGSYLFGPSGVKNAKGDDLSRQQLLDFVLHDVVTKHPELGLTLKGK